MYDGILPTSLAVVVVVAVDNTANTSAKITVTFVVANLRRSR
jgi:hypothetical protein